MLWRVLQLVRPILALGLLGVSAYCAWLSLMLADPGNFRTEGSPAGAAMFVVWLLFPVIALGTGLAGLLLLFLKPGPPPPPRVPYPLPASAPAPVAPRADRVTDSKGATLDCVSDGALAVVWLRRPDAPGLRTNNAQWRGDQAVLAVFRALDGSPLRLPRAWAVPDTLASRAIERFRAGNDWTGLLSLRETPPLPAGVDANGDRARWDWLRQHG